jgi:SAM-dependent methyltransferase
MALFKNSIESNAHSLKVLNLLREYDTFLESLSVVADLGCGNGHDAMWFADLTTRDDPPEPLNLLVYAIDKKINRLLPETRERDNIVPLELDFEKEELLTTRKIDLIWAHDSFQCCLNPMKTLANWKNSMTENGMLILSIPQTTYFDHSRNRLVVENHSHQYYNYNILNLIYMLALNGFDCRDAYFYREAGTPWLYAAVYASQHAPLPEQATWYDLAERKLINDSLINSVQRHGYARLDDLIVSWLDKDNYFIKD